MVNAEPNEIELAVIRSLPRTQPRLVVSRPERRDHPQNRPRHLPPMPRHPTMRHLRPHQRGKVRHLGRPNQQEAH